MQRGEISMHLLICLQCGHDDEGLVVSSVSILCGLLYGDVSVGFYECMQQMQLHGCRPVNMVKRLDCLCEGRGMTRTCFETSAYGLLHVHGRRKMRGPIG